VGLALGMRFGAIADGLRLFDGVQRRLQVRGEVNGVLVLEDYAHHPTEIAATLEAIRWIKPERVICVFQPHLFSRTKFFCDDFARVLGTADRAIVTDIYPSREEPMPGVNAGLIVEAARRHGVGDVSLVSDMQSVPAMLAPDLREGDIVLILGAGNINRIAEPLLGALGGR
jgi:UDP-N-acetylmuramate--alanine ligase